MSNYYNQMRNAAEAANYSPVALDAGALPPEGYRLLADDAIIWGFGSMPHPPAPNEVIVSKPEELGKVLRAGDEILHGKLSAKHPYAQVNANLALADTIRHEKERAEAARQIGATAIRYETAVVWNANRKGELTSKAIQAHMTCYVSQATKLALASIVGYPDRLSLIELSQLQRLGYQGVDDLGSHIVKYRSEHPGHPNLPLIPLNYKLADVTYRSESKPATLWQRLAGTFKKLRKHL